MSSGEPGAARRAAMRVSCLQNPSTEALAARLKTAEFVWADYDAPSDDDFAALAEMLNLHPLAVQAAGTFPQRPKLDEYEGYMLVVVCGVDPGTASGGPLLREVNMIISGDYVITLHRRPFAALSELSERLDGEAIRSEQFLVYKILNAVISTFEPVLGRIDDDIDDLEQNVVNRGSTEDLQRIFSLKRDLIAMRRVVTPMRDMFARNADRIAEVPDLQADDRLYFRDLYDELVRVSDLVDSYRDLLSGATDMYLSAIANRQGEINKQLTIIATIFLPLTFLTGFFGQNFAWLITHVLNTQWAFWVFGIGSLVVSAIGFYIFFRRKRWI